MPFTTIENRPTHILMFSICFLISLKNVITMMNEMTTTQSGSQKQHTFQMQSRFCIYNYNRQQNDEFIIEILLSHINRIALLPRGNFIILETYNHTNFFLGHFFHSLETKQR